jgi:hemoglobin
MQQQDPVSVLYDAVGGDEPFNRLVDAFYKRVETDPVLRPLYPEDLNEPKRKLALFLIQRTGGPTTYSNERGHPRMRQRHMPFKIGLKERDAWLHNMFAAIDEVAEFKPHRQVLHAYFIDFATFLVNQPE